jgi:hypothetical protein
MPPKVGGFALGFAFLMQGDDPGHTPGIFDDIGVIPQQDSASHHYTSHVLVQNKAAPVRDQGIETPGTSVEKMSQSMIAYLIHVPEATDGGDGIEVVATYEAEDDHTERHPWEMARKEVAKSMEHLVKGGQSRHRSPPLVEDCIEENDRMLALFFQLSFVLQSKFYASGLN